VTCHYIPRDAGAAGTFPEWYSMRRWCAKAVSRDRDITTVPTPAMVSLSRCIAGSGVDHTTRATARLTDL
jgi:hypothetical protein